MTRGFVIMAQNTKNTNYVFCATVLAMNIKQKMPESSVSIVTNDLVNTNVFDNVIKLPYGDIDSSEWKLKNDWQVYEASPYAHTIKIEADMYLPRNIDHWWEILKTRDLNICTTIRDYKNNESSVDFYRKTITQNKLANTYNAITYFKKSELANDFYNLVKDIFLNWNLYSEMLSYCPDRIPTTDVVYALASRIIGDEYCVLPTFKDMSFIHMKQHINKLYSNNWTQELTYEILDDTFRINSYAQLYPIHYYIKEFSHEIWNELYEH